MKIVAYIVSGILILFGALYLVAANAPDRNFIRSLVVGFVFLASGKGVIAFVYFSGRRKRRTAPTYKSDLPGESTLNRLQCQSCGGQLSGDSIKTAPDGSVIVSCEYCNATYQMTEKPKW